MLKADGHGWEVDLQLDFRETDTLLVKKYVSCFFGTDLVPWPLPHRVDTLIITGCTTSGCVRATPVDACQNGFRPIAVREAVGDRSAAAHAQILFDVDVVSQRTQSPISSALVTIRPRGASTADVLMSLACLSSRGDPDGQQAL
jgi:nicotinamidase-related amidase